MAPMYDDTNHPCPPGTPVYEALKKQALSCSELWNMAMEQRRNKYSWGKANAETQIAEIEDLQELEPRFQAVPASALIQVIQDLDAAYAHFLKEKDAFKRHEREAMPPVPQPLDSNHLYPLYYDQKAYRWQGQTLILVPETGTEINLDLELPAESPLREAPALWVHPTAEGIHISTERP